MMRPFAGAALFACTFALCGCAVPMSARDAQRYALIGLNRYCRDSGPCDNFRVTGAERLKQGWLVDFDASHAKYGVFVHDNRVTDVSVWSKTQP